MGTISIIRPTLGFWIGATLICAIGLARASEDPEPGIWLEMGLLACERGEVAEAERIFSHIETHFDPPAGIQALIAQARNAFCSTPRPPRARVATGIGWSSNVNFGPSQTSYLVLGSTPQELRLVERLHPRSDGHAFVEVERRFTLGHGTLVTFGTFRHNFTAQAFDEDVFGVSYQFAEPWGTDGRWQGSLTLAEALLGGERYADFRGFNTTYARSAFLLTAHWQAIDYPRAPAFDAHQLALRAGMGLRWGNWSVVARVGGLVDRAASAQRPGGDRIGRLADIQASRPGPGSSRIEFVWRSEWSHSKRAYLPGLFDMRRDRRYAQVETAWQIPMDTDMALRLSCVITQTHESVPFLGFRQVNLDAAWIWTFR